jgi:hypothetical protein
LNVRGILDNSAITGNGMAAILAETVEKWSIQASRRMGRHLALQGNEATAGKPAYSLGQLVGAVGIEPTTPPV